MAVNNSVSKVLTLDVGEAISCMIIEVGLPAIVVTSNSVYKAVIYRNKLKIQKVFDNGSNNLSIRSSLCLVNSLIPQSCNLNGKVSRDYFIKSAYSISEGLSSMEDKIKAVQKNIQQAVINWSSDSKYIPSTECMGSDFKRFYESFYCIMHEYITPLLRKVFPGIKKLQDICFYVSQQDKYSEFKDTLSNIKWLELHWGIRSAIVHPDRKQWVEICDYSCDENGCLWEPRFSYVVPSWKGNDYFTQTDFPLLQGMKDFFVQLCNFIQVCLKIVSREIII